MSIFNFVVEVEFAGGEKNIYEIEAPDAFGAIYTIDEIYGDEVEKYRILRGPVQEAA